MQATPCPTITLCPMLKIATRLSPVLSLGCLSLSIPIWKVPKCQELHSISPITPYTSLDDALRHHYDTILMHSIVLHHMLRLLRNLTPYVHHMHSYAQLYI